VNVSDKLIPPYPIDEHTLLRGDENLQLVVRAHLHCEQLLFAMLTEGLRNPSAIDLDRLTFLTKARLAVAMGLMMQDVVPVLTALNSLRNSFAHKVDYKFTEQDKQDLLNTMPAYVMKVMLTDHAGNILHDRDNVPLERILIVIVCIMDGRRQDVVESKKADEAAFKRLRESLDRSKRRTTERS
jgi:hypothetical protein